MSVYYEPSPPKKDNNNLVLFLVAGGLVLFLTILLMASLAFNVLSKDERTATPAPQVTVTATATPTPTPTETETYSPPVSMSKDDIMYAAVEPKLNGYYKKKDVIELGHLSCKALDQGMTLTDLTLMTMETGMDAADVGIIVGASVAAFCPEHKDTIESWAD